MLDVRLRCQYYALSDWVGNRKNPPADPNTMEYNSADQLTRWPGQHQYGYYPTGSLHEQWNDGMTSLQKTYSYTPENLLSSVVHEDVQGDPASTMTWDADGNRVSFTSSTGGTYQFVYDTTAGIPAVIEEVRPTGSVYYIREPEGALIARISGSTGQVVRYYHFDELGSTRLLTDDTGTVTDTYTYDAWGNTSHVSGTTDQPYQYVGRLGYYSHHQDANLFNESGWQLLQLGVRFYDPEVGRLVQLDPAEDGWDWYVYADNSPVTMVDPSGMSACFPANSQICNDTKDQCVIVYSGGPYSVLRPGKCTSSFWDHGDSGYFRGRWRKCRGEPWACHVRDGSESGFRPPPPGIGPPPKSICRQYCRCQMKSKHKRVKRESNYKTCMKSCLHP